MNEYSEIKVLNERINKTENTENERWDKTMEYLALLDKNITILQVKNEQIIEDIEQLSLKIEKNEILYVQKIKEYINTHEKICNKKLSAIEYINEHPYKSSGAFAILSYLVISVLREILVLI